MIKYAVCPGRVISKTDRQVHYVTAPQLMRLYGLNPEECLVFDTEAYFGDESSEKMRGYTEDFLNSLEWFTPSYEGNYAR